MAAKDCIGCGSTHESPLHWRYPLRPGNTEDSEESSNTDSQWRFFNSTDTRVSEHQTMDTANQVSGSGFSDNSATDTCSRNISTKILLLRELKKKQ